MSKSLHHRPRLAQAHRQAGLSLVEVMIVLVIIAILTAIAWPAYQDTVRKGRRSDAMAAIGQVMQSQERWRSNNTQYQQDISALPGASAVSAGNYYNLSIVAASATATRYTVQANTRSGTPQAQDSQCASLQALVSDGNISYRSIDSSGTTNAVPDPCWVQ